MKYLLSVNNLRVARKFVLWHNPTYTQLTRNRKTSLVIPKMRGVKTNRPTKPVSVGLDSREIRPTSIETNDIAKSSEPIEATDKRLSPSETFTRKKIRLFGNCDIPVLPIEGEGSTSSQISSLSYFHTTSLQQSEEALTEKISDYPAVGLQRFGSDFYDIPCQDLAIQLLGHILVRKLEDGTVLKGRIVETESYLGGEDKASHSFNGKVTERSQPMYMKPGTAYVYFTYGMYHCFNISSQGPGAAVLIRALEPLEGEDFMAVQRRTSKRKPTNHCDPFSAQLQGNVVVREPKRLKPHELCNGPAKLCISLNIERKSCNKQDLAVWDGMWIEKDDAMSELKEHHIVKTSRIGIDSCGIEWATKPLRFYIIDNKCVSRRDLVVEKNLKELGTFLRE